MYTFVHVYMDGDTENKNVKPVCILFFYENTMNKCKIKKKRFIEGSMTGLKG